MFYASLFLISSFSFPSVPCPLSFLYPFVFFFFTSSFFPKVCSVYCFSLLPSPFLFRSFHPPFPFIGHPHPLQFPLIPSASSLLFFIPFLLFISLFNSLYSLKVADSSNTMKRKTGHPGDIQKKRWEIQTLGKKKGRGWGKKRIANANDAAALRVMVRARWVMFAYSISAQQVDGAE